MILSTKQILAKNYINFRGWKTKRKLLLIESDDWGAIRMPSRQVYEKLVSKNIAVDKLHIDKFDSLEGSEDLEALFDILASFKDINKNPAVLTAYSVVANPDFDKIEANNRTKYIYELISETYKRSNHTENTLSLIHEGIKNKVYYPQFHGREHIHPMRWIEAINSLSQKEDIAFREKAIISSGMIDDQYVYPLNYFAAFDYSKIDELNSINNDLKEGLNYFENIFGFKSLTFVAQGSKWGDGILETLANHDVKLIPGQQVHPDGMGNLNVVNKLWGAKNNFNQIHWRRNCTFEPARNQEYDWVNRCLKEIEIAFRWGKPAVISSHRENFIGSIFPENRDQSLKKLKILLREVQKRWPDVEFLDTERLAHIMMETIK